MHSQPIAFLELLNGRYQYIVPRWQRRYRWGEAEIARLVDDLLAVAQAGPAAGHYGGTLLTFPEPGVTPGTVTAIRVVDGQQRLTTVSILLACIAERLGADGACDGWTAETIHRDRLTNPDAPPAQLRKLRLQDGDEEEYRDVLAGGPGGAGAVTQAWKTVRRLVADSDISDLLQGLGQLRVVSIGLDAHEDPQQIFESLNATGRPLAESEKVKNWLLMGLPDADQQELHDGSWRQIERVLAAVHETSPVDEFLRDVLRWWTGRLQGIDTAYDVLRRLAVHRRLTDRPKLCRDLAGLARLYGVLTGAAGPHSDPRVEEHLRHLRALGIHVHRPLSLRLLADAEEDPSVSLAEVAEAVGLVSAWVTRLWLAGRPTAGLNKAVAELAYGAGPGDGERFAAHWRRRINALRAGRAGVPDDSAVAEGIRSRRAYGGNATPAAFAVLCAIMEAEHREEAPARDRLTMEHVMPQKLSGEWREYLGADADGIHATYRDRLANLTLSGDATNASMGAKSFDDKAVVYRRSSIGMTREVANETRWDEDALERRSGLLGELALALWPWEAGEMSPNEPLLRWRLEGDAWKAEDTASAMVLNVAGALMARSSENADRLSGNALSRDVQSASLFPAGSSRGGMTFRAVPGRDDLVMHPYDRDYPASAERCRRMAASCNVGIEVELRDDEGMSAAFWQFLKDHTGGLPGQTARWRGASQWTSPFNGDGDRVGVYVGNPELLWLYVRSGSSEDSPARNARMRHYSSVIRSTMGDQRIADGADRHSRRGWSVSVERPWVREDRDEWPETASWIKEQAGRLAAILESG